MTAQRRDGAADAGRNDAASTGLTLTFASAETFADLVAAMTQKRRDHRPSTVREAYDWMKEICDAEGI